MQCKITRLNLNYSARFMHSNLLIKRRVHCSCFCLITAGNVILLPTCYASDLLSVTIFITLFCLFMTCTRKNSCPCYIKDCFMHWPPFECVRVCYLCTDWWNQVGARLIRISLGFVSESSMWIDLATDHLWFRSGQISGWFWWIQNISYSQSCSVYG